jgi:hypothetical protein
MSSQSQTPTPTGAILAASTTIPELTPSEKYLALHIYKWHPLAKATRQGKTWFVRTYPEMKDYGWYWGSRTFYRGLKRLAAMGFIQIEWHPHPFSYARGHCTWILPTDKMSTLVEQIEPAAMARSKPKQRPKQNGQNVQIKKQGLSLDGKDSSAAPSKKEDSSEGITLKKAEIADGIIPKTVLLRQKDFPDYFSYMKALKAQEWGVKVSDVKGFFD